MSMEDYNFAKAREAWSNTRPWYTIDELNAWADKYQNEQWHKAAIRLGEELAYLSARSGFSHPCPLPSNNSSIL